LPPRPPPTGSLSFREICAATPPPGTERERASAGWAVQLAAVRGECLLPSFDPKNRAGEWRLGGAGAPVELDSLLSLPPGRHETNTERGRLLRLSACRRRNPSNQLMVLDRYGTATWGDLAGTTRGVLFSLPDSCFLVFSFFFGCVNLHSVSRGRRAFRLGFDFLVSGVQDSRLGLV